MWYVPMYPVSKMMVGVVLVGSVGWGAAPHSCLKQHRYMAMMLSLTGDGCGGERCGGDGCGGGDGCSRGGCGDGLD